MSKPNWASGMPQPDDAVPAARRRNMAAIKGRDTKPELIVRRQLHAAGFRFRLHRPDLPGRPDIALPKYRTVIFVHGCFWHRHNCRYFKWPKTRAAFWRDKIGANVLRDRKRRLELERLGWKVLVVWECETRSEPFSTLHKLSGTIRSGGSRL